MIGNITHPEPTGTIVAFEGHPEIISTQLRLLPTSPQILILPSVQCYLPTDDADRNFEAHDYIRKAHTAVLARNETARAFLQQSTATNKRLVFMNGGAPSAQAMCIRAIMRHETQGDDIEAEAKFNFLVKEGLAGLETQAKKWEAHLIMHPKAEERHPSPGTDKKSASNIHQAEPEELEEDPITRAMRAAEALDRQTASLQPSNDLDLTIGARPRSLSLPMYGYSDNFGDAAPFYVFGAQDRRRANSDVSVEEVIEDATLPPSTPAFAVTHYDPSFDQPVLTAYSDSGSPSSPSCAGETYCPTFLHSPLFEALATSRSDVFDIHSSADVVFGEASLIDMRLPGSQGPVARVRSLDRIYPSTSKFRDLCVPSDVAEDPDAPGRPRPHSCIVVRNEGGPSSSRLDLIDGPRTIVVRAKQPNIVRVSPVPSNKKRRCNRSSYVDRGTDAEILVEKIEPFLAVLPVMEDLVVYFKDEVPDALLDNAIKGFKDGIYPVLSPSPDGSEADTVNDQLPGTPKSHSVCSGGETPRGVAPKEPHVASPSVDVDDYDPFAYEQVSWPPRKPVPVQKSPTVKMQRPPTPEQTPAPSVSEKDDRHYEFRVASNQTAVAIQNSLRSVLNVYFPPETQGYRQFHFSLLPELEGLWKPIFREAEPGSPRAHNRRMDLILAIGSQKVVKKEYSLAVTGLLDKLGSKKSGLSRSGRLDFRYLLANAMQAFTAQPLTSQTSDNPFNNPYLLATLIIPHLETYLALHSEVRYLLLEYPPEHLSTILALQKLVGVDLMKVAQIVDSNSGDLGAFKHIRGGSIDRASENSGPLGKPAGSDVIVSKANFLLTSSANEAEIATFVATVRNMLIDVSQFYTPEEPPAPAKKPSLQKAKPAPLAGNFSAFPKTNGLQSPTTPKYGYMPPPLASPVSSTRPNSIAETVRTFKSRATAKTKRTKSTKQRRPPTQDGAESIMTYDPAEDSDYDFEERRLMPMFLLKPSRMQKPNSRKALKFLGLA